MKKKLKNINQYVIVFLLGGLILGSIGVYATSLLSSSEVSYDNSKSGGNSNNVQKALEELYEKSNKCVTGSCSLTESNFFVGYTYNENQSAENYCITGDEVTCKRTDCYTSSTKTCPSGTIIDYIVSGDKNNKVRFHVMYDKGKTLTMQSQKNIVRNIAWYSTNNNRSGPLTILPALENATIGWSNVNLQTYTMGETVFKDNAYTGCDSYNSCATNTYTLASRKAKARMMTVQEASNLGCTSTYQTCPIWIYNYLYQATSYGGTVQDTTLSGSNYNWGYWLVSGSSSTLTDAWMIYRSGQVYISGSTTTLNNGARAVVVVDK